MFLRIFLQLQHRVAFRGHLQACAAKLRSKGRSVDIAMCGGKTVYDQDNRAFHLYEYPLDEYEP